ncbi:MAG: GNAT family N-acetyltransferase [Parvibaculum sp.]|nr:GNAT family N-acetyltransferase [Parvibaculum sp.]
MSAIVPVAEADLTELARLHAAGFDDAWDARALAGLMASPGVFILKAEDSGKLEGFVMARIVLDEAEILTITVGSASRGKKLGTRLMEAVAALAMTQGVKSLFLEVAEDNEAGLALYRRMGFECVGRRAAYYGRVSGAVAALTMALKLP